MLNKVFFGCLLTLFLAAFNVSVAGPPVRFSEIHYDNTGTDTGEAIEISGPAGADITGWTVVLYNGSGGASYNTQTLTGTIPATCGARGVLVLNYPTNGIQNGGTTVAGTDSPDGLALVDNHGVVIEFLSYEGVFAATNGPATGLTSTDIGVRELGNEPAGMSLARSGSDTWSGPAANSFGACNDDGGQAPPQVVTSVTVSPTTANVVQNSTQSFLGSAFDASNQPIAGIVFTWTSSVPSIATISANGIATGIAPGDTTITATAPNGVFGSSALHVTAPSTGGLPDIRFTELHYDNAGTDVNEAIEIEGPAGADLTGYTVVLYDGNGGSPYGTTQTLSGPIPATCNSRGVIVINYPANGIQNGSPDGLALVDAGGHVVEFLSYEGAFVANGGPASGLLSFDIGAAENSSPVGQSLQRDSTNQWHLATSTFGACNTDGGSSGGGNHITFSGRSLSDPALPVGFQAQLFATLRDAGNAAVTTTFTWSSETPAIASIDQNGVMTAIAEGSATFRATATDGTTATDTLPTIVAVASTTAIYTGNTEFGEPQDADPSDDFIVRYPQYTASYNVNRGTPNWVSYVLDPTDYGTEDRCNCFTPDPALPASFPRLSTNDYTGAGAIAGYGIDRGHMTRSFDRTSASLDNAVTYYFTNVAPQAADLNQGPWAHMEDDLGDFARSQNKEVFVIAGVAGNKGTLKNEGKIVIPASTWKIAVVMNHGQGLADIHTLNDLQVIAVIMPNDPGVRDVPWQNYQTTVRAIEQLTGYDFLARLPDNIERAVETNTQPPTAVVTAPSSSEEGSLVTLSGAASSDTNGSVVSYAWTFSDGGTATGSDITHVFTQDGVYTISLLVTDNDGLTDTTSSVITVTNVAPVINDFAGATLNVGQSFTAAGSFSDPGDDTWNATVNWGDGSAATQAPLGDRTFSLAHTYATPGTFTVTVTIADDDTSSSRTQTVSVKTSGQELAEARTIVDQLVAAHEIGRVAGNVIKIELATAERELARGHVFIAKLLLRAVLFDINALVRFGQLSAADAAPLLALVTMVLESA